MLGEDLAVKEAVHAKLRAMRRELLGENPTPVERLPAERVAMCWLQAQEAEPRYAQGQKDFTIRQADYHQRRMDAARRRYPAAIKTLATVRKLAVPGLQINVVRKQVKVAASTAVVSPPAG